MAETIGERLTADIAPPRRLPPVPLESCEKRAARVFSMALVRYRTNDYSVPTVYGFQEVVVRQIGCQLRLVTLTLQCGCTCRSSKSLMIRGRPCPSGECNKYDATGARAGSLEAVRMSAIAV
jgi:hypothetical protein